MRNSKNRTSFKKLKKLKILENNIAKNSKKGILLVNLGSPKSTKVEDVKEYLDEFLMDERVIDYP